MNFEIECALWRKNLAKLDTTTFVQLDNAWANYEFIHLCAYQISWTKRELKHYIMYITSCKTL